MRRKFEMIREIDVGESDARNRVHALVANFLENLRNKKVQPSIENVACFIAYQSDKNL